MEEHNVKGHDLIAEADAMVNTPQLKVKRALVGSFFSPNKRQKTASQTKQKGMGCDEEKASLVYRKAGNHFKMAHNWSAAGNAFAKSATYREHLNEVCMDHVESANCFKKTEPEKAIEALIKATEIQTGLGKFALSAKYHQEAGVISEHNKKLSQAIEHYETAAQLFRSEVRNAAANKCLLKAAEHAAILEDYEKAIRIYEELAPLALESNLLKYSAEDHYFRAGLCHLCVDFLNAQHALSRYDKEYPAFMDSRKAKLLKALANCVEQNEVEAFECEINKYESVIRFDPWYTILLTKVKNNIRLDGYELL